MRKETIAEADTGVVANEAVLGFGPFHLLHAERLLVEGNRKIPVGGRAFDILSCLIAKPGQVVTREELSESVWPGIFVADGTLRVHIAGLRKALGDGTGGRRFIITVPGKGYSFVAPVRHSQQSLERTPVSPERGGLPASASKTFGRQDAIAAIVSRLPERCFMTIIGIGGVGKTTVALAAAEGLRSTYADGILFVDFAPISDAAMAPSALASSLGLPVNSPEPIPSLIAALRNKNMLLLLDNCENVLGVAATLAEEIRKGAPSVHVLATSRERLRAKGEFLFSLLPLELPPISEDLTASSALTFPALQLFADRAAAVLDTFEVSDANVPIIADICRRLDGIALAIEMAASRVDTFGVQGLAAMLDDRFKLLQRGLRTASVHQQTLRATFDWSWQSLTETSRNIFHRLSLFAGEFSLEAANSVASGGTVTANDVAEAVATLVETSLLSSNVAGESASYRLLESTRAYARERLLETGEFEYIANKHAEYCLITMERAFASGRPSLSDRTLRALVDDARLALNWTAAGEGHAHLRISLTVAAVPLWLYLSLNEECRVRVEAVLSQQNRSQKDADENTMKLHSALGTVLAYTRSVEANAAWSRTLEIAETFGDVDYQLRALHGMWTSTFSSGHLSQAQKLAEQYSVSAGRNKTSAAKAGNTLHLIAPVRIKGMIHFYEGELNPAREHLELALLRYAQSNDGFDAARFQFEQGAVICVSLATTLWLQGFPDQAIAMADRSLSIATRSGHQLSVIYSLAYIVCRMAILTGDVQAAERHLEALEKKALSYPLVLWRIIGDCWKGVVLARKGEVRAGAELLRNALTNVPVGSFSLHHSLFLAEYAHAVGRDGDRTSAIKAIEDAIRSAKFHGERWYLAELLRIKGDILLLNRSADAEQSAEAQFEEALEVAREQGARSWELRGATSMAILLRSQGRYEEAKARLLPVYNLFSEGHSTGDLNNAKALLDSLAVEQ
ncbi:MAG: ATP-binding protein [Bradyrhizobium sp.]